ncbi:MAG TPA: sugar transferase [Vicinamibacteria bacterium]|nr:sugar transferase [Vicinamibacteria bacterium]
MSSIPSIDSGPSPVRPAIYVGARTGRWLFQVSGLHSRSALHAKRVADLVAAAGLLLLAAPVLAATALLVKLTSRGPVLFVQKRVGLRCREFPMYKFRTMRQGAEREQDRLARAQAGRTFLKIERDPRVTAVGGFLRRYSLDELPQLVNVLRGDMSLVGPRPVLPCDFDKFPKLDQLRRFSMPPGVTGLWQVSGRSACTDEQRIALDLTYVDRWSLGLDLSILARTVPVVLSGRGAS